MQKQMEKEKDDASEAEAKKQRAWTDQVQYEVMNEGAGTDQFVNGASYWFEFVQSFIWQVHVKLYTTFHWINHW